MERRRTGTDQTLKDWREVVLRKIRLNPGERDDMRPEIGKTIHSVSFASVADGAAAVLHIEEAGHGAGEPGIRAAIVAATDRFALPAV